MDTEWIDITLPLQPDCPAWPGDKGLRHWRPRAIADGHDNNTSVYAASAHLGTHLDAPCHYVRGAATIDQLDPALFVGPAWVADVQTDGHVSAEALARAVTDWPQRLLIRTRNSRPGGALDHSRFDPGYCALTLEAAELVVERGVRLLGIDYFSIDTFQDSGSVHRTVLGAGLAALEGLDLRRVQAGPYTLIALPIKLVDFDGAPVRAVLRRSADPPAV